MIEAVVVWSERLVWPTKVSFDRIVGLRLHTPHFEVFDDVASIGSRC